MAWAVRSARALQALMALAGERFPQESGRACAGGNIWGGNFDPRERGRRGGPRSVGRRAVACWSAPSAAAAEPGGRRREATIECLRFIAGSVASKRGWSSANFVQMLRVSAVTTLITDKVCSASRLAADITFFTSHVDPFKVVRLSEFKSKKSMTMRENSARTFRRCREVNLRTKSRMFATSQRAKPPRRDNHFCTRNY